MSVWHIKEISKETVAALEQRYGLDAITASIFARRGITAGKEVLYFLEDDLRFQQSPFSFTGMEDAVDRINDAIEEKEKILIFGDKDVDGVTATTVLYDYLVSAGADVQYRLPQGTEGYGLSMEAVDDFAAAYGSLIITVDCGISNNAEIAHAAELGMDVIVTDHHEPQEQLPAPAIILDPKCVSLVHRNFFRDISGCAVAYKLVSALRFSKSSWYKQPVTLLDVQAEGGSLYVSALKTRNLFPTSSILTERLDAATPAGASALPDFLRGEIIAVWDKAAVASLLRQSFFASADFELHDVRELISALVPAFAALPLSQVKNMSRLAKYGNHPPTQIGGLYNIFVTYAQMELKKQFPALKEQEEKDLQLVALAAVADIMPLRNENRIFVRDALRSLNERHIRPGLLELMASLDMLGKRILSKDLGWTLTPCLNAPGRLGQSAIAAGLFTETDVRTRERLAEQIRDCNNQRKQLSLDAEGYTALAAKASVEQHKGKLCLVIDERINKGITGSVAAKIAERYDLPALVVTFVDDVATGSMRSARGVNVSDFLNRMEGIFLSHGGHIGAGGFSFKRERLAEFEEAVNRLAETLELKEAKADSYDIDANIPPNYLTPALLKIADMMEPFGEENPPLLFQTKGVPVSRASTMGKGERLHLKLELDCGKYKWPAVFWGAGDRLHRDFEVGDRLDLLYHVERNYFNGAEIPQVMIVDMRKSQ
ncbi:MAG: single-stranded-DNA-specific exonuclease RecJ [Treponema sp.]|nr:single-stranded-DNA-specific exonuclease RecJ [Treponema sp.]